MNNCLNTIFERKSVRKFSSRVVTEEQLELLAKAGMSAPSAANKQPWEFVLITDKNILVELADRLPYAKMTRNSPAAIVICGNLHNALPDAEQEYWVQDCSAATQNILLAAESVGLGAVWTGVYPMKDRIKIVSDALELPEFIIPLNVIPLGYPDGNHKPMDKFDREKIHHNNWEK